MVQLACGWVIGPLKPYVKTTNYKLNIVSAWYTDNHSCGFDFFWTSDGKHVGNPNKTDHPLHIVRVVKTVEEWEYCEFFTP